MTRRFVRDTIRQSKIASREDAMKRRQEEDKNTIKIQIGDLPALSNKFVEHLIKNDWDLSCEQHERMSNLFTNFMIIEVSNR